MQQLQEQLVENLLTHLVSSGPKHSDLAGYQYSLFPAGKLFRPILAVLSYLEETTTDLKQVELSEFLHHRTDLAYLASFLESHHVYTLIHDDLPCMDNDDERRGRAANHIKFGQWQALLTGDGLSIYSFGLLSKIKSAKALDLIKIATKATGPQGLIYGQYLDLSHQMQNSFQLVKQTHLLKTARLIQLSLAGGQILASAKVNQRTADYWRLGESLGLVFQFLDDLDDLREENEHEQAINPWNTYSEETYHELNQHIHRLKDLLKPLPVLSHYIDSYLKKNAQTLKENLHFYKTQSRLNESELLDILSALDLTSNH